MSIHARLRLLLALSILVVGGSVWLVAGQQREAVIGLQGELRVLQRAVEGHARSGDGFARRRAAGEQEFLKPYRAGRSSSRRRCAAPRRALAGSASTEVWSASSRTAQPVAGERAKGGGPGRSPRAAERSASTTRASARCSWTAFRSAGDALRAHVEQRAQDRLERARWLALGFVMLFSATVLSLGIVRAGGAGGTRASAGQAAGRVCRSAAGRRRRGRSERAGAAAGGAARARRERGRAHAQREWQRAGRRDGPAAVPGLAAALADAKPRGCLAIRRGHTHERTPGAAPLQTPVSCATARRGRGALRARRSSAARSSARCSPSGPGDQAGPARAGSWPRSSQAAPVLANLRNLAIAEHRAATDPLTGSPTPARVQEALIRMVAQSTRTGAPLSAHRAGPRPLQGAERPPRPPGGRRGARAPRRRAAPRCARQRLRRPLGREEFVDPAPRHRPARVRCRPPRRCARASTGSRVPGVIAHITASLGVATLARSRR